MEQQNLLQEKEQNRHIYVYDIETLASCFTYTAYNVDTFEVVQYVIHKHRNELPELLDHLSKCKGQIGFNNQNFDYPIIHYILSFSRDRDAEDAIACIYRRVQEIIENQNTSVFGSAIRIKDVKIPQLDLFRLWHYNNRARSTSLKSLEISMNYPNVLDMPIDHSKLDIEIGDIPDILDYNLNDVMATYAFYLRSTGKIELRKSIEAKYGIKCTNYSDSRIGEELILTLYSRATGLDPWDVKKMRSPRESINLKDCVFDYVQFRTPELKKVLTDITDKTITQTKGSIKYSKVFRGFKYVYGTGGIHGCIKPGLYESDKDWIIIDADVASLYPNIAIKNGLFIEHLGPEFIEVYDQGIVQQRLKAKAAGDMTISDALKLAANTVYGKSNEETSFLYDPLYTMKTTINGQLLLTMLCEDLVLAIPELIMLQVNTDGVTVKILRSSKEAYDKVCVEWEKKTKLTLEYAEYAKMAIRDVNNYIAISTKGKVKSKGAFEVDKVVGSEPAYHKDNSFRIVPLAIQEFFEKGIPVEQTIKNHENIYDFCGRQKFVGQDYGVTHTLDYKNGNAYDRVDKQQKNTRYYISKKGSTFIKHYVGGDTETIHRGYQVQIFNKYVEKDMKDYNINYDFYIKQAYREIDSIIDKQLNLF